MPYISTTNDINIAKEFNFNGKGLGVVEIDLNKVPSLQLKGYEQYSRFESAAYHYSVWQQETSVYQHIPQKAINGFVK